ncbi:GNAT family N-acetyltransferase [Paenibacillus validus]|uniref:GNAT family N-acetyltransferase n=1 Tax=Paenibacillus validus TaxID=44253 RepID=UPI0027D93F41|nr:GNAT family N-acetyltransferase [Paenibacillus validus]
MMLTNLKTQLQEPAVRELLEYSIFPDPDLLEQVVGEYERSEELELYGYEEQGELVGIVGFTVSDRNEMEIKHLAVHPDARGRGYGRGQILELLALKKPARIVTETDEEAVNFYRNIGFTVIGLGEKYPGIERYRCEYEAEIDDNRS